MRSWFKTARCSGRSAPALVSLAIALVLGLAAAPVPASAADAPIELKFGTLAPEGTSWTDLFTDFKNEMEKQSGGRLHMKLYAGGALGDERDMIRKMNNDQLHAVGVTGIGLAQILPEIHVLDLPMLFETYEEVDYVYPKVLEHFEKAFDEKGYVFLGFTEVGFTYLFSKKKVQSLDDLRKDARVWAWEGDPLIAAFAKQARIAAISVPFTDVVTALQTGLLDTVYAPPYAAVALQWSSYVKFMGETALGHGTGGVLVKKKKWAELPDDVKQIVRDESKKLSTKLVSSMRSDNERSKQTLIDKGIQIIPKPSPEVWNEYIQLAKDMREAQVGKLYTKELLDLVLKLRDEARAAAGKKTEVPAIAPAGAIPAAR